MKSFAYGISEERAGRVSADVADMVFDSSKLMTISSTPSRARSCGAKPTMKHTNG